MKSMDHCGHIWRKSSYSASGNCVEMARLGHGLIGVRDSKNVGGPVLRASREEWAAFLQQMKS